LVQHERIVLWQATRTDENSLPQSAEIRHNGSIRQAGSLLALDIALQFCRIGVVFGLRPLRD
jgi:hypothetical protein